jgi:group II intron reverse transcriptase/maturase
MEPFEGTMAETQSSKTISTKLGRIAEIAKRMPGVALTSLSHHIDMDWMREAHRRTRKDGAAGVDKQTAVEYAVNLEEKLASLLDRAKSLDHYRAPPVRRVYIPKGNTGKMRPIGIPCFEDKVLQKVVSMALNAVYEQDFLDCSYGFRPGRSQHMALEALRDQCMTMQGGWVLELDVEAFYDTIDKGLLQEILRKRVRDGVLLRLIGKWLNAGVMEEGVVYHPETGTPQGGVVSSILANVFLHEVLDTWFERDIKPRLRGKGFLVRYADDGVFVFETERDARGVLAVLSKRFEKYGLKLHPEKTRLLPFHRPKHSSSGKAGDLTKPASFNFLGFTHYWGRSLKGYWVVRRKTEKSRFSRARKAIADWCRTNRHLPIKEQHEMLTKMLKGHDGYYGITGNGRAIAVLRRWVERDWFKWLRTRSRAAPRNWEWMQRILEVFPLPPPRVGHSVFPRAANP